MKMTVRSAQDLQAALEAPEGGVVMAAHRTIRQSPQRALALGSHEGRDVVDALIAQASGRGTMALVALGTLSMFDDARVLDLFLGLLRRGRGPTLDAAGSYLAPRAASLPVPVLVELLMENESLHRVRVTGRVLRRAAAPLPEAPALRLALLDPAADVPVIDERNEELWVAELQGVLGGDARAALESQGREAFDRLMPRWRRLPADVAAWLLLWGTSAWPEACVDALETALSHPSMVRDALTCIERDPALAVPLRFALRTLLGAERSLRLRAIRAGAAGDLGYWSRLLEAEPDGEIRAACVERWALLAGTEGTSRLVQLLADPHWMVRAAASDALVSRGEADAVRPLAGDARVEVRSAAMQVLAALGEDEWLEEAVLVP